MPDLEDFLLAKMKEQFLRILETDDLEYERGKMHGFALVLRHTFPETSNQVPELIAKWGREHRVSIWGEDKESEAEARQASQEKPHA